MEDLTLALITLTSFVLLFVVAIFADRAGIDSDEATAAGSDPIRIPLDADLAHGGVASAQRIDADVA
jgi:hypothetical protein